MLVPLVLRVPKAVQVLRGQLDRLEQKALRVVLEAMEVMEVKEYRD